MQKPTILNSVNYNPDDPLLKRTEEASVNNAELPPGEEWWIVKVDNKEVQVSARDRAHLVQRLKALYPGAKLGGSSEQQAARQPGKRPNFWERKRQGGGVDAAPNLSRAAVRKSQQAKAQQQQKGRTR